MAETLFLFSLPPILRTSSHVRAQGEDPQFPSRQLTANPGRRELNASIGAGMLFSFATSSATAAGFPGALDKYIKKKKLDPLDTYIPVILLCQAQLQGIEGKLTSGEPDYVGARSLLRSGPVGSLRADIRAVAQYASEEGNGKAASDAVDQSLRALEELDSLLLRASRNDASVSINTTTQKLAMVITGLDSLLGTVPAPIVEKGRAIASSLQQPNDKIDIPSSTDLDLKTLQDLL